jgi:hypothetical protein
MQPPPPPPPVLAQPRSSRRHDALPPARAPPPPPPPQVDELLRGELRQLAGKLEAYSGALGRSQQREVALLLWTSMIFGLVLLLLPRLSGQGGGFRRLVMLISVMNGALGVLINVHVMESSGLGLGAGLLQLLPARWAW